MEKAEGLVVRGADWSETSRIVTFWTREFGRVRVPMSQLHPVMLVPDAAVVTDQSVKMLFTVAPDGTVVPKPVELGPVTDDIIQTQQAVADRFHKLGLIPRPIVIREAIWTHAQS